MKVKRSLPSETGAIRIAGLALLIIVQVVTLVVLNVFDYAVIFPSRSGLTPGHAILFCGCYLVALVWGTFYSFRRFHWAIGASQIVAPILLWTWLTLPQHYDAAKY